MELNAEAIWRLAEKLASLRTMIDPGTRRQIAESLPSSVALRIQRPPGTIWLISAKPTSTTIWPYARLDSRVKRVSSTTLTGVDPQLAARPFAAFGLSHGVVLIVLAVVAATLVALGRRHRGTRAELPLSRSFAVVFAALLVPVEVYWLLPGQSGLAHSLPLQLCDLAAMATVWALWSHSPTAFALTYFWGLTLTSQAFLSPELTAPDFPSLEFLSFFGMHSLVLWAAIYLTWGVGLRPGWRSYRIALLVTIGWATVMFGVNHVLGTNYGFLNAKPQATSLLDLLGPWPWYLPAALILTATIWALITYPWTRRSHSAGSAGLQTVELPR